MKLSRICLTVTALLFGCQLLNADILILKNGDKKEGNILEEKPDAIRMKYKITPKIWDEKDFPRAEIAQIIKQRPEEIEIVDLRKVLPTDDLLTANQYERIIQDKLRPFINKYPGTAEAKEVDAMIETLQDEKGKVVAGQLKVEGAWLTAAEVKRDMYNIQAFKIRRAMQLKAAEQDYTGALREFDRLTDKDSGYPASLNYVKAIPEAIEIMIKYEAVITRMIAEQPIFQKQRDDSLAKLVEPDLGRTKAAIAQERSSWQATYEAEKKSKVRWMTQYKYDLKALQLQLKMLVTERGKLQLIDLSRLKMQNEALSKTLRYLADGNAIEAEIALTEAQAVALKESSQLISGLRTRINALKREQATNKSSNRALGGGSSAVGGSSAAIQDDRVALAMAEAEKKKEEKKSAGEAPAKKAAADNPDDDKKAVENKGDDEGKKTDDKKPADDKGDDDGKKKSKAKLSVTPAEEEGGIQQYLLIGAGILIAVLLVAFMMQKKKS